LRRARCWLALAGALVGAGAHADGPDMAREGAVAYFCGGVGADERRAMKALEAAADLKLLFVTAKRGGYLAGAELTVSDAGAARLRIVAGGPICLLRLPAGSYRIAAAMGGTTRVAQIAIGAGPGKPQRIVFSFPGEPWDGIWASPEEKLQAQE
jgi:hypothetical protein